MAVREFAGNAQYRLPKGKVEPYRLWFEYLRVALRHPEITVDAKVYKDWGVTGDTDFDGWWSENWQKLFATQAQTAVISEVSDFKAATNDPSCAVIRVSLSGTKKSRIKDIEAALAELSSMKAGTKAPSAKPAFAISSKRSMNLKTLRGMLKYLQLYEQKNWDIEGASLAYFKWSRGWNDKVRSKKWKRPLVYAPPFLGAFANEIEKRKASKKSGPRKMNNTQQYDYLRSQARRFIRRGEKILRNVAVGKFPGSF